MAKTKAIITVIVLILILAACGGENANKGKTEEYKSPQKDVPQMIDVKMSTEPVSLMPGDAVKIIAQVTLGEESIEDANEVFFEVWADGHKENAIKIEGTHEGEGLYSATETFAVEGIYYAIAHVTVREMHNMPRLKMVVGDVPNVSPLPVQEEQDEHGTDMDHLGY